MEERNRHFEQEDEVLRRATAYCARDVLPLVTDLADEGIPVALTCRVLGFGKWAYPQWQADPVTQRDCSDARLIHAAREVRYDDPWSATAASATSR